MATLDPGFVTTAGCTSAITYIHSAAGTLRYRGYPRFFIGALEHGRCPIEVTTDRAPAGPRVRT